jgi:hypothetical protein
MTLRQAPARHVFVVIGVLASAIAGLAFIASWMSALTIPYETSLVEGLKITDVQFNEGFVTVTLNNTGINEVATVTEIMVGDLHELNHTVRMNIPIHMGEQASITVGYDWISSKTYQIIVTTAYGNNFRYTKLAP